MNDLDFMEDMANLSNVSEDNMKRLADLVATYNKYQNALGELKERVKKGEKIIREIETEFIPSIMEEIGMSEYKLADGSKVTMSSVVAGRIPSQGAIDKAKGDAHDDLIAKRAECFDWLRNHNAGSIIKREFSFNLGKGDESEQAKNKLLEIADELKLPYQDAENVHAMSLNAILKELVQNGVDVPVDTFGLFVGNKAKIVKPKTKL